MTAEKSSEREKDYPARRMNINEDEKRSEEDIEWFAWKESLASSSPLTLGDICIGIRRAGLPDEGEGVSILDSVSDSILPTISLSSRPTQMWPTEPFWKEIDRRGRVELLRSNPIFKVPQKSIIGNLRWKFCCYFILLWPNNISPTFMISASTSTSTFTCIQCQRVRHHKKQANLCSKINVRAAVCLLETKEQMPRSQLATSTTKPLQFICIHIHSTMLE